MVFGFPEGGFWKPALRGAAWGKAHVLSRFERVQGKIEYLEQRTGFSQITLDNQPLAGGTTETQPAWDTIGIVERAWNASLRVLQALAAAFISVFVFGRWLLPVLVVGLIW